MPEAQVRAAPELLHYRPWQGAAVAGFAEGGTGTLSIQKPRGREPPGRESGRTAATIWLSSRLR